VSPTYSEADAVAAFPCWPALLWGGGNGTTQRAPRAARSPWFAEPNNAFC